MRKRTKFGSIMFLTFVMCLSCLSLACQPNTPTNIPNFEYENHKTTMSLLHIALQDGFVDDEIVIQVNGEEVFYKSRVKTRFQIGLADSLEVNVQTGTVNVVVTMPLKNLSRSTVLQVSNPTYLGVSLTSKGEIDFRVSNEQFGYL